jgi:hypothetical protein
LGIALFTIVGLEKAHSLGANDFISVMMGMIKEDADLEIMKEHHFKTYRPSEGFRTATTICPIGGMANRIASSFTRLKR